MNNVCVQLVDIIEHIHHSLLYFTYIIPYDIILYNPFSWYGLIRPIYQDRINSFVLCSSLFCCIFHVFFSFFDEIVFFFNWNRLPWRTVTNGTNLYFSKTNLHDWISIKNPLLLDILTESCIDTCFVTFLRISLVRLWPKVTFF